MQKAGWLLVRLGTASLIVLAMLSLSLSAYAFAPLYTRVFYNDWHFWRYWKRFLPLTLHLWKVASKLAFEPRYRKMTSFMRWKDWVAPPRSGPCRDTVQVSANWPHPEESCGECSQCCERIDCPAHEPDNGLCSMYDSVFWHYFPCGRYPGSQQQIDYYECPKWELIASDRKPE